MKILIEEYQENLWAASLDKKGRLQGLEIDPVDEAVRYGSIYRAKVLRIDTALDAAFLSLDGMQTGILYNKDVRYRDSQGQWCKGGDRAIGKVLSPGEMVAVQAKTSCMGDDKEVWQHESKTAQMSMDVTLPGRYLIYGPMLEENRVSRRIRNKKLRQQLLDMLSVLEDTKGFILRSAAADMQTDILAREARILREMWSEISTGLTGNEPGFVVSGPNAVQRILSDSANGPIEQIEIVTMEHFGLTEDWCAVFAPDLVTKIVPVALGDAAHDLALFAHRDVLRQIQALLQDYVVMERGNNLIIQETAALTVIDVNMGTDKRPAAAVNTEVAREIAQQIRLRNIGGMIVVDFLKTGKKEQESLLDVLDEETAHDPCTVQIHGFTKLGLLEMTRKRRTCPLSRRVPNDIF